MKERRPAERKRKARGLGARDAEGDTAKATPEGRMPAAPRGSFEFEGMTGRFVETGTPRPARAAQARRRTVRDNPRAGRSGVR